MLCPLLKAETAKALLGQAIKSSAKEGWEYSANGGYVFEAEVDLIGDEKPEKMVWFSIDDYGSIHIFESSTEQKYLGKLDRHLLGAPMIKEDKKTTILSISDTGNHSSGGEEPFTKKVLSTVISEEGVERLERIAGVGPGDIEDTQYNVIQNGSMTLKGSISFKPQASFTSLRSYLNGEDNWREFRQGEWVEMDSYLVHQDDVDAVRKIKSLSDENEIRNLLGDFTKEKALKLLGGFVSSESSRVDPKNSDRNIREKTEKGARTSSSQLQSKQKKMDQSKDSSRLPWIIAGLLLVGILALLFKVLKGKSAS